MYKDIVIAITFFILVLISCKLWGMYVVRQYEKKSIVRNHREPDLEHSRATDKIVLAGTGDDGNSDYSFSQAAAKIEVSRDAKVKVYDKKRF